MTHLPALALVSTGIRRDLLAPLKHFTRFELRHFYCRADYGDLTDTDLDASLQAYHSPRHLYQQLNAARPAIIQGVEPFSLATQPYLWAGYLAARRSGAKLLAVTLENRPLKVKFGPVLAWLLRTMLRPYFAYARLIIPLNEGARRNLMACDAATEKIKKLMWGCWGVDTAEYSPERNGHEPAWVTPTILFIGRLHEEKGIFDLLEAFGRVRQDIPNAALKIIGGGPQIEQVRETSQVLKTCEVLGAIKNRDLPPLLRAATVFASPSQSNRKWEEQVGMTNLQAMACGVPVISTRSGAIPEYVPESAGVLVPERDPTALAEALLTLLRDPALRQRMGQAGREYATAHYDAAENVQCAEEMLLQLL